MPLDKQDFENHVHIARQYIFEAEKHLKEAVDCLDKASLMEMFRAGCIVEDICILTKIDNSLGEWRDERCLRPRGPTASGRSKASSAT
jgi:hypothetical protein